MFFLRKNDFFYLKYIFYFLYSQVQIYIFFFCKMKSMLFTNNIIIYYFLFSIII